MKDLLIIIPVIIFSDENGHIAVYCMKIAE